VVSKACHSVVRKHNHQLVSSRCYAQHVPNTDELIGQNVARYRGDLSQRELATRMRELGWKWSHLTVASVERGERPLRLAEAQDLARVLETQVYSFTSDPDRSLLIEYIREVARAEKGVLEAFENLTRRQFALAELASVHADSFDGIEREWVEMRLDRAVESELPGIRLRLLAELETNAAVDVAVAGDAADEVAAYVSEQRDKLFEGEYVKYLMKMWGTPDGKYPTAPER